MKFLAVVLLAAVAVAEPKSEADPALFYSNFGYNYAPYAAATYNYAPYRFGYSAYNYGSYYPYAAGYRLFKREAEAESEADPAIFYNAYSAFPYYNRGFYNNYAYAAAPYAYNYAAYAPSYYSGYRYFAKRSADSDSEADPAIFYNGYNAFPYYNRFAYNYAYATPSYAYNYAPYAAYGARYYF